MTAFLTLSVLCFTVQGLFTFDVLTCLMTPRRAVAVGLWMTFVTGFILAGYNGTAIYVWYTTGKVEILGSLEDSSFVPPLFARALVQDFLGFLTGALLLICAAFAAPAFSKSIKNRKEP